MNMTRRRYARSGAIEPLRQLFRAMDFLLLLAVLRVRGCVPRVSELRRTRFIELGPGPTRLAWFKRCIFSEVIFLDQSDFGIPDRGLKVANFEEMKGAPQMLAEWCRMSPVGPALFFADHCLEHISEERLAPFLRSIAEHGYRACFRVPNTLSARGLRSFQNDATHRTPFQPELRQRLGEMGFAIIPWARWYRPLPAIKALFGDRRLMGHAEEIAVCASFDEAGRRNTVQTPARAGILGDSSRARL
jgi:hypothetical protein